MADHKRNSKRESVKSEQRTEQRIRRENNLARRIIAKYGTFRKLEDSICLEGGTACVSIQDLVYDKNNRYHFVRAVIYEGLQYTSMRLKVPEKSLEVDEDQLDTTKWELDRRKMNMQCYTPVMIEEMFTSGAVEMNRQATANLLFIGLGAGYLNSFLHATFPKLNLTGVEIEPELVKVARKWFGLILDDRQRVYTMDGVKFIKMAVREGRKYDVVVLDACLVDMSYEFNCPIKQFLERKHLENVSKLMTEKGVVLVNVLSFKMFEVLAAEKVKSVYEKVFRHCTAQRAKDSPPNMVISCTNRVRPEGLQKRYTEFARSFIKE